MMYFTINQKLNQQPASATTFTMFRWSKKAMAGKASNQQLEINNLHPKYNLRYKVETNKRR